MFDDDRVIGKDIHTTNSGDFLGTDLQRTNI